jgi:hypothetical protein
VRSGRTAANTLFRNAAGWRSTASAQAGTKSLEAAHAV